MLSYTFRFIILNFNNTLIHSPSSGFIDIKPLSESVFNNNIFKFIILLIIALIATISFYYILKKINKSRKINKIITPEEEFTNKIRILKNQDIAIREFSEQLSYSLRQYIQYSFNLPACNSTTLEIVKSIRDNIKKVLPLIPKTFINELLLELEVLLFELEEAAYGSDLERFNDNTWRKEKIEICQRIFFRISEEIKRERERSSLITENRS